MKTGTELIAEERQRQITKEGYSLEHDDAHNDGEIVTAAMAYLDFVYGSSRNVAVWKWPWSDDSFKPAGGDIKNLVKAGALIAAEIDRLQREAVR